MPSGAATMQAIRTARAPACDQPVEAGDGAAAGGEHGIDHQHEAVGKARGQLRVVLRRHRRRLVALQAEVTDARRRAPARAPRPACPARRAGPARRRRRRRPAGLAPARAASGPSRRAWDVAHGLGGQQHADAPRRAPELVDRVRASRRVTSASCTSGWATRWTGTGNYTLTNCRLQIADCRSRITGLRVDFADEQTARRVGGWRWRRRRGRRSHAAGNGGARRQPRDVALVVTGGTVVTMDGAGACCRRARWPSTASGSSASARRTRSASAFSLEHVIDATGRSCCPGWSTRTAMRRWCCTAGWPTTWR